MPFCVYICEICLFLVYVYIPGLIEKIIKRPVGAQDHEVWLYSRQGRSPLEEIKYLFKLIFSFRRSSISRIEAKSAALDSATQHAMPSECKWETDCLNFRFPLPTVLCPGYSVKLKLLIISTSKTVESNVKRAIHNF